MSDEQVLAIREQEREVGRAEQDLVEAKEEVKARKEVLDSAVDRLRRLIQELDQPSLPFGED